MSEETRIRLENLLYIEGENHDKLPNEVFVIGFLRAFAKAIGADGDEAVRRYQMRLKVVQKLARSEADLKLPAAKFWRRLLFCIVALLGLIFLSVFALSMFKKYTSTESHKTSLEQPETIGSKEKKFIS